MNYALLIARQRSGTGAIGSVLDKHPSLKYLGEVFHPSNLGQEQNYFTFARAQAAENPDLILPDSRYDTFEAFLAHEAERFPGKTLVVDVKYRSLHQLDGGWRGIVERPTLLSQAMARNVPILHLTRNNAVETFVSGRLAEANKVWHARADQDVKVRSVVLDIRQMSNYIVNTEREIEQVKLWTQTYPHLALFDYSEMFDDAGLISTKTAAQIARVLGTGDFSDRAPSFIKQAPTSLRESIENFELVERALSGTNYSWMLR